MNVEIGITSCLQVSINLDELLSEVLVQLQEVTSVPSDSVVVFLGELEEVWQLVEIHLDRRVNVLEPAELPAELTRTRERRSFRYPFSVDMTSASVCHVFLRPTRIECSMEVRPPWLAVAPMAVDSALGSPAGTGMESEISSTDGDAEE